MGHIIVFPNSKGGAGKTTAAFILATELTQRGLKVTIIDADPNHPIYNWQKRGGETPSLSITKNDNEKTIMNDIDKASEDSDFVIVDLEGSANLSVGYAVSLADLVVIPSQRSSLDAEEAAKTVALVKNQSRVAKRKIPVALLLTRTNQAIRPKGLQRMLSSLESNHIDAFITEIYEREAFRAVFDHICTLAQLKASQVSGLDKARANAAEFAAEVIRKLQQGQGTKEDNKLESVA